MAGKHKSAGNKKKRDNWLKKHPEGRNAYSENRKKIRGEKLKQEALKRQTPEYITKKKARDEQKRKLKVKK